MCALYMPPATDLVEIHPPATGGAELAFQKLTFAGLSWNAFLVTTWSERAALYKWTQTDLEEVEALERAITNETRKISIRRCVWNAQIASVMAKAQEKSSPVSGFSVNTKQHDQKHADPFGPLPDTTLLSEVIAVQQPTPRSSSLASDTEAMQSGRSCSSCDDDDDLTKLREERLRSEFTTAVNPLVAPAPPPRQDVQLAGAQPPEVHPSSSFPPFFGHLTYNSYVGIENQANTCYLSSALQSLFHVPYFRSCIYNVQVQTLRRQEVTTALQSLFGALQLKYPCVSTVPLTTAFKWSKEEVRHQHDVHEMILILLDCIEKQVCLAGERSTSPNVDSAAPPPLQLADECEATHTDAAAAGVSKSAVPKLPAASSRVNFIQKLFRGEQSYVTKAVGVSYESRQAEPFLVVELPVENVSSMENSLTEITKPQTIDGFMIEDPVSHQKSSHSVERALSFTQLPPVLMVHPNRVVFDFKKMAQVTVNNKWTFPVHLDLRPYSASGVAAANDKHDEVDDDLGGVDPAAKESEYNKHSPSEDESQMLREGSLFNPSEPTHARTEYELRVVVLHSGTAMSGHYITCVRLAEGKWICLNDATTSVISESDVLRRAYGGFDQRLSLLDREERAKLLVYVRKSCAARLLTEVAVPEHIKKLAYEHEKKTIVEYYLLNEAFANALGSHKFDTEPLKLTVTANETFGDAVKKLAARHEVSPDAVVIWRYGYRYVEHQGDRATRVTTREALAMSYLVVELLTSEHSDAPEEYNCAVNTCFPTRVFVENRLVYIGTSRSVAGALQKAQRYAASVEEGNVSSAPSVLSVASQAAGTTARSAEPSPQKESCTTDNSTADSSVQVEPSKVVGARACDTPPPDSPAAAVGWVVYSYYGSSCSVLRIVDEFSPVINGGNLIVAPASVKVLELRDVLEAQPIDVAFFLMHESNCDEATELFTLHVDENMDYMYLQTLVHDKLSELWSMIRGDERGADVVAQTPTSAAGDESPATPPPASLNASVNSVGSSVSSVLPSSPTRIGFHSHHIDTCGPSRTLQVAKKRGTFAYVTKLRDMIRGSGSQQAIRRLYIEFLPESMEDVNSWATMQQFIVSSGFNRRCTAYACFSKNSSVGDFLQVVREQAVVHLPELQDTPLEHFRILGLDWNGKIYRHFTRLSETLLGSGIYSYAVDALLPIPPPVQQGDETEAPKWQHFDLYHITRYSTVDEYIAPPTNILLDMARPEAISGEMILQMVLHYSGLDDRSDQWRAISCFAKVILRGQYISDSVVLDREETITTKVLSELDNRLVAVLIDHSECMFSMMSKTPSPGRSPATKLQQRAPEAGIRIADDDDD